MRLPRFLTKLIPNFKIIDLKEWLNKGIIEVYLRPDENHKRCCHRCGHELHGITSSYKIRVQSMPIFQYKTFLCLKRAKGHCSRCKKIRSEDLDFLCPETPHFTRDYAWWLGRFCEVTAVSQVGKRTGHDGMTMWRLDFNRMKRMFQHYKIPRVRRISVDEVYARSKKYHAKECRDNRFFTIICDLDTRRVVWVSESRSKQALDEFFHIIGPQRCQEIKVAAIDQHDAYKASIEEHCPNATVVWDRFHIMQNFESAVNEDRAWLSKHLCRGENKRLTRGKYKQLFLKRADRRSSIEKRHIKDVLKDNEEFAYLELIKEGMFEVYNSKNEFEAREKFVQIGEWIRQGAHFYELKKWWKRFEQGWGTFKNYFDHRVSSSLSEGQNNVIKAIKRRGFGYRNMTYFKLKILQVCGFLNSDYVPMEF